MALIDPLCPFGRVLPRWCVLLVPCVVSPSLGGSFIRERMTSPQHGYCQRRGKIRCSRRRGQNSLRHVPTCSPPMGAARFRVVPSAEPRAMLRSAQRRAVRGAVPCAVVP